MNEFECQGDMMPLILECGHSFCKGCITRILRNRSSQNDQHQKCPVCNHPCINGSVNDFKKNFSLLEEIQTQLSKEIVPEECLCADRPSFYCTTCTCNICRSCCTGDHLGHSMLSFNPDSFSTIKAASNTRKILDKHESTLTGNIKQIK